MKSEDQSGHLSPSPCIDHGFKGDKDGYSRTRLNGKHTSRHRKVFFEIHGFLPEVVMHTCDNPRCINPEHLVAGTIALNNKDRVEKGRSASTKGELNGAAKLKDEEVLEILRLSEERKITRREIAASFGISIRHLFKIISGARRR